MMDMTNDELDAMIEEGADLIDEIVSKNSKGQPVAGGANPLVNFIHGMSLFKQTSSDLILEAAAQTPELEGLSPEEMVATLKEDPDLMSNYTRTLARLDDEAEARPQEDDDGRAEPNPAAPGNQPTAPARGIPA